MRGYPRLVTGHKRVTGMVPIPMDLRPQQHSRYPSDNAHPFERWYMDLFVPANITERLYLPIQWTALYCNNKYGTCQKTLANIQAFINTLDRSQKYYTIVQYDDGILNDLSGLDIKVFGMSGGKYDYPIPLLCHPHRPFSLPKTRFATFAGNITHEIRKDMFEQLKDSPVGYYCTTEHMHIDDYTRLMSESTFSLAPRGYGPTSFRIGEAILAGSIPVYISDVHILPYDRPFDYGVLLHGGDNIQHTLEAIPQHTIADLQQRGRAMRTAFLYEGCKAIILSQLNPYEHGK